MSIRLHGGWLVFEKFSITDDSGTKSHSFALLLKYLPINLWRYLSLARTTLDDFYEKEWVIGAWCTASTVAFYAETRCKEPSAGGKVFFESKNEFVFVFDVKGNANQRFIQSLSWGSELIWGLYKNAVRVNIGLARTSARSGNTPGSSVFHELMSLFQILELTMSSHDWWLCRYFLEIFLVFEKHWCGYLLDLPAHHGADGPHFQTFRKQGTKNHVLISTKKSKLMSEWVKVLKHFELWEKIKKNHRMNLVRKAHP